LDFGSALTYQFRDARWTQKFLLAALLSLIPILGQVFVFGWALGITRRVIEQKPDLLPELDLTADLVRGIKGWGLTLIYALPALVVALPLGIGVGVLFVSHTSQATPFWGLLILCLMVGVIAYSLLLVFVLPASYALFIVQSEHFAAGLDFKRVYRLIRGGPVAYFMVFIGGIVCGLITFLGLAGCIIGVIVTSTYSMTVIAHLYGQAYLEANAVL
jgi:hypothetical protein